MVESGGVSYFVGDLCYCFNYPIERMNFYDPRDTSAVDFSLRDTSAVDVSLRDTSAVDIAYSVLQYLNFF